MNELSEDTGISSRTYKKRKKLTAAEKWQIYEETCAKGAPAQFSEFDLKLESNFYLYG